MSETTQLPAPNIQFVDADAMQKLDDKLDVLIREQDFDDLLEMTKIYPLPAEQLDDLKRHHGIQSVLESELNLANAIAVYGEAWLEG